MSASFAAVVVGRGCGGRHCRAMNHIAISVSSYMNLHAKIPLIAFAGLMHFRIPFFLFNSA